MGETPAVAAFITERQNDVLKRGLDALRTSSPCALKEQVHRLMGTFGTYMIPDAVAAITPLHELLSNVDATDACVEQEKASALASLTETLEARGIQ